MPERTATDDPQPDAAHPDGSATSEAVAGSGDSGFDAIADELYELPPDEFVPARDDRVAAAKEAGDRDLARALGRLRRPTKAAWLANLLARHRTEQLDGLVALARGLAQAQQELDGGALRALSGQRHRVVAAMARDAGRLAARRGETVNDGLVREVAGILDAALADPAVAEEVRAGRLTKTVRYSGFGPAEGADFGEDMAAWAASAPQRHARRPGGGGAGADRTDAPRTAAAMATTVSALQATRRSGRTTAPGPSAHVSERPSGNAPSGRDASSSPRSAPPGNGSSPTPRPRRPPHGPARSPTRPSATAPTSGTPPPATGSPSSPPRWTLPATRNSPPSRPSAPPRPPPATRPATPPRPPCAPPAPAPAWTSSPPGDPASRHLCRGESAPSPPRVGAGRRAAAHVTPAPRRAAAATWAFRERTKGSP